MKSTELRAFFEPHIREAGFEFGQIYEIGLEPFHWVIYYYDEDGFVLEHRMELTDNQPDAPATGES